MQTTLTGGRRATHTLRITVQLKPDSKPVFERIVPIDLAENFPYRETVEVLHAIFAPDAIVNIQVL